MHSFSSSLFLHFSPPPTLTARINIPWAPEEKAAGLEERTGIHGKKTLTLSLQQSCPFFILCFSVDWARWGIYSSPAGSPSSGAFYIWHSEWKCNQGHEGDLPFLLVPPMKGNRLLVAFSVLCCIHTDTHMYVCLLPRTGQTLKGYL